MRRFFKNLYGSQAKPTTRGARRPSARPQLEQLEDRRLLTAFGNLSAIVDSSGQSVAYAIGAGHAVSMHDAAGWHNLGGDVTQISAARDPSGRAEVFAIGTDNSCWQYDAGAWHDLGGYVTQISGDFYQDRVYAIRSDHAAWMHDAGGWHSLGGYVTQISAGCDPSGRPELFAIGGDQCCWQYEAGGWHSLGSPSVVQVCETATPDECWVIDANHAVWQYTTPASGMTAESAGGPYGWSGQTGGTWKDVGGYVTALSSGYDSAGRDEVFAIGSDHAAWVYNYQDGGWRSLGGNVTAISGTAGDTLFAVAADDTIWEHDAGGWHDYSGSLVWGGAVAALSSASILNY